MRNKTFKVGAYECTGGRQWGNIPESEGPGSKLTLTSLSQPQDTMMGLLLLGEKRTQDTHSEWLSSYRRKGN